MDNNIDKQINYYEILEKLQDLECQLYKYTDIGDFRELQRSITSAKAYIFSIQKLRTYFDYFREKFYNNDFKSEEYAEEFYEEYQEVQQITKNLISDKEIIKYSKIQGTDSNNSSYEVCIKNIEDNFCKIVYDIPNIYYYPSVILLESNYKNNNGMDVDKNDINKLKIANGIDSFYSSITYRNICQNPFSNIYIPKDIEFYLCIKDIDIDFENGYSWDIFCAYFFASCICYVLKKLQKCIKKDIQNTYYNNVIKLEIENLKKEKYKTKFICYRDIKTFYINNDKIELTQAEADILYKIANGEEIDKAKHKDKVSRINKKIKKLNFPQLIKTGRNQKLYKVDENIYRIQL